MLSLLVSVPPTEFCVRSRERFWQYGRNSHFSTCCLSVLHTAPCSTAVSVAGNNCVKVEGKLTLYTDGSPSTAGSDALSTLISEMGAGSFDNATPDIVRVIYVANIPSPADETPSNEEIGNTENNPSNSLNAGVYVAIAAGGVAVIAIAILFGRRQMRERQNDDAGSSVRQGTEPSLP